MTIVNYQVDFTGETSAVPRIARLYAPTSTLAEIATAGFLDPYIKSQNYSVLATDFVAAVGSDGHQWYKPVFSVGNVCTLTVLP